MTRRPDPAKNSISTNMSSISGDIQFTCQSSIFVITHSILYISGKVKLEYIIDINEYLIAKRREGIDMRKVQCDSAEHFDTLFTFVYFCH